MNRALVVGGGILGTMHAWYLRRAGFEVVQLEADIQPAGASVRNFGLIWVGGRRAGAELSAAIRARRMWEELATRVPGIGFRPDGSLTVAEDATALKVMEDWVGRPGADAAARRVELLDAAEVPRVNPAVRGEVLGALWCRWDAVIEPRAVLGALRQHLDAEGGYRFAGATQAVELDGGAVTDHRGQRWDADLVVAATGAAPRGFLGVELSAAPVQPVRLQMLQTEPHPERLATSLADADSLRYYPAYQQASLGDLPPQSALAARYHLQLLVAQRADGSLTIGDTHLYREPFDFDLDEAPSDDLLRRTARILGRSLPPVARRWEGVYLQRSDADSDELCYRAEVHPGVWLVTGPGGRGMTCAPVIATETLAAAGVEPGPVAA